MRKSVLLLLLTVCSILGYAQRKYESVLEGDKVWKMEYKAAFPPEWDERYSYEDVVLQGDTLIDGIPFKSTGSYWIGQKDGVVYEYDKNRNMGQIFPIMDFTLNVGDEFIINDKDYNDEEGDSLATWETDRYKVVAVSDTIIASSMDKRLRHCVYVNSIRRKILDCWVEGIGSLTYGILGDRIYWVGSFKRLLQCTQGDEVLYSADTVTSIQTPQKNEASKDFLFDLQGRPAKGTPKHGIYIKDGRKVIK